MKPINNTDNTDGRKCNTCWRYSEFFPEYQSFSASRTWNKATLFALDTTTPFEKDSNGHCNVKCANSTDFWSNLDSNHD